MEVKIDYARSRAVFARALACYRDRRFPYDDLEKNLPQNMVIDEVRNDKLRFARHLFASCHYMRGTVISSHAFKVLNELQEESPWLFDERILERSVEDVQAALGAKIPWQQEQVARLWHQNFRILFEDWGGDPRNIFEGVKDKKTLYRRVMGEKYKEYRRTPAGKRVRIKSRYRGFGGFLEKMTSMLAYFLEATKLIKPTPLSAPIDFHHFRFYIANLMITFPGDVIRYEKVKAAGIKLAEYLQREFALTQVEYGDIVWLWSLIICRSAPHTTCSTAFESDGNGGKKELKIPIDVDWGNPNHVKSHERSCGLCEVSDFCSHGIPAGVYYNTGKFEKRPREDPPQPSLFTVTDVPRHMRPKRKDQLDEFNARFDMAA